MNRKSLISVLSHACNDVIRELERVPLEHWDESVFRFFVVQRLRKEMPRVHCETEWHRIDLLLREPRCATLIELKFFRATPLRDHHKNVLRLKGGPSKKNYREYKGSLKRLRAIRRQKWIAHCGRIISAYMLLAYSDAKTAKRTFGFYYDKVGGSVLTKASVSGDVNFTVKLIKVPILRRTAP